MVDAGNGGIRLRSWICAATAQLLLAACGGHSADSGETKPCTCDGGAGKNASGCTEFRVDASLLPAGWLMFAPETNMPVQPFWRDKLGLHVAWTAVTPSLDNQDNGTAHLLLTTFPSGGGSSDQSVYDVFPSDLNLAFSGSLDDAAANPDGAFAVAYRYRLSAAEAPHEAVLFGEVGNPNKQNTWTNPWPNLTVGEVSWDGDAFAVHLSLSNPGLQDWGVQLVRFSPDGELLSGPVLAANITPGHSDFGVAVDDPSGTTAFVGPAVNGVSLSGHLRDGTPLFPNDTHLTKEIAAQGVPAEDSAYAASAAIAMDGKDAVVAWRGLYDDNYIQTLADFDAITPAIVIPQAEGGMRDRVLASSANGWVMFARNYARGDVYEIQNDQIAHTRLLVSHSFESCWQAKTCPDWPIALDIRNLQLVRWEDELWLGFLDLSDSPDVNRPTAYRIVNAAANCEYRSLYDEHHPK